MYRKKIPTVCSILFLAFASLSQQQLEKVPPNTNFTAWDSPTVYPNEQTMNVSRWLEEARNLSSPDFRHIFQNRCITGQVYPWLSSGSSIPGFADPYEAFDGVYFVGSTWVSAWAIDTGDGLILIDTLDNEDEARELIIGGIQKFGFDGSAIKAVIVTHEHADHYGGARWLQETFDVPVFMSEVAWNGLADDPANPTGMILPPIHNETLVDGVGVTVGNVTVTPIATPGHTKGTFSFLFSVYDQGVKHVAALYGGGGIPSSVADKEDQIRSFDKFGQKAVEYGADVLISNHANQDDSLSNFEIMKKRPADSCGLENPFVVGVESYVRYLQMNSACVRVQAARLGQDLNA